MFISAKKIPPTVEKSSQYHHVGDYRPCQQAADTRRFDNMNLWMVVQCQIRRSVALDSLLP